MALYSPNSTECFEENESPSSFGHVGNDDLIHGRKPLSAADRHNGKSFGRYGGFFFSHIRKEALLRELLLLSLIFLWKSMIRTGGS